MVARLVEVAFERREAGERVALRLAVVVRLALAALAILAVLVASALLATLGFLAVSADRLAARGVRFAVRAEALLFADFFCAGFFATALKHAESTGEDRPTPAAPPHPASRCCV